MRDVSPEDFFDLVQDRNPQERLDLREISLSDMELSGRDLSNIDFSLSVFHRLRFDKANLQRGDFRNALFDDCSARKTDFRRANFEYAVLRYMDMSGCDISGANVHGAIVEFAKLDDVISDEQTRWFGLHCPERGAFLGYKKCFNNRLVQLLIPADAKRSSATLPSCRCDKAKVLSIKSFDYKENYQEAYSLADENFIYRVGEWIAVRDFNADRWMDSTTGIHFWLTREEAKNY